MFHFYKRYLGHRLASVATGITYALMVVLILYASLYPHTELKYVAL